MVHFLTLHPGDRFRYREGGPVFRRAPDGADGRARVDCPDGRGRRPVAVQEFEGCFVIPAEIEIDEPEGDD
jgi:hypothetical protein